MEDFNPCKVPMDTRVKLYKTDESPYVDAMIFRSAIGSLRYLVYTRPDIVYLVRVVSRYLESPTTRHLAVVKQILRHVKGTINYGCNYIRAEEEELELVGYRDSDLAGDIDD